MDYLLFYYIIKFITLNTNQQNYSGENVIINTRTDLKIFDIYIVPLL